MATETGKNRTGIATSPVDSPDVIEYAAKARPPEARRPAGPPPAGRSPQGGAYGDDSAIAAERIHFAKQAEPIATVPPPATIKGVVKTAAQAVLKGEKATVFLDKLGERLAFERTGVRLYDLALSKAEVYPTWEGGPRPADLLEIREDELEHFGLLQKCMTQLGADPTAMTPSADLAATLSKGVPLALADPRTDLRQCLEGLLVAELTDNAGWENLVALARDAGQDEMATRFERALEEEQEHLARVKRWVRGAGAADAHFELGRKGEQPPART